MEGLSRAFLAQITRHRIGSFTSASQHYADYRSMPMVVHRNLIDDPGTLGILGETLDRYTELIDEHDVPAEEARMVLPNACAVNIIWTVNARSLINFFDQRLCNRNVEEMRLVSQKVLKAITPTWPEFAELMGPRCYTTNDCNQGHMACGLPWSPEQCSELQDD